MPARTIGRITSRAAFVDVQRSRCRGASGPVRAAFSPVPADADADAGDRDHDRDQDVFPQVGYAIGRHCGGAVVRNRLRRRLREVVRQSAPDLPRGRYLLRLDAAAAETPPAALRAHAVEALFRAARRAPTPSLSRVPAPAPAPVSR
ncbi:MAG TPA: ribonuclease P protein component [Acidimicrobiales bacterium]